MRKTSVQSGCVVNGPARILAFFTTETGVKKIGTSRRHSGRFYHIKKLQVRANFFFFTIISEEVKSWPCFEWGKIIQLERKSIIISRKEMRCHFVASFDSRLAILLHLDLQRCVQGKCSLEGCIYFYLVRSFIYFRSLF